MVIYFATQKSRERADVSGHLAIFLQTRHLGSHRSVQPFQRLTGCHRTQEVDALTLEFLGLHRVKVYRVNEEYTQLYQNRTQDSRDLNEPPSNIRNGLGVFSAFSSDSAFFTVLRR